MKVSLKWLKELVDVHENAGQLAETLTRGGIEVGGVEYLGAGMENVVVGQISKMEKHPNADKLWVCQVTMGDRIHTIVTGAQNLSEGDKVPAALPGAILPNGTEIKISSLRGIDSAGMLCSTEELLLDEALGGERSKGGIFILDAEAEVGKSIAQVLGREDSVLDLELYPNRPDCLAMVNVAREVASLTGEKVHLSQWANDLEGLPIEDLPVPPVSDVKIVIEESALCLRYAALLVEDVVIEPSPVWMQHKLLAAGVRPINNIVDITNYCMLEMGQPLHAFDLDQIEGAVHVRRARKGEKLVTLDNIERLLDEEMLLITDEKKPLGLAGVMGGLESEVTGGTKRLLIESAHFNGVSIRRTSRRLGLRSEASNRFEKGVNSYTVLATLGRVCELLTELKAGRPTGFTDEKGLLPELRTIVLSARHASALLGTEVKTAEIEQVLERLEFAYREMDKEHTFSVQIPTYRSDIHCEEDLIEEIARIIGYDRIPTTLPQGDTTQGQRTPEQKLRRRLRQSLVSAGMTEVVTYSFTSRERNKVWSDHPSIPLLNPLREELGTMRTILVPNLLEVGARNLSRRNMEVSIFEIGNIYLPESLPLQALPKEVLHLAGFAIGKTSKHWSKPVQHYDFFYMKGILENLAQAAGVVLSYQRPEDQDSLTELLHPGRSALVYAEGVQLGFVGELHPLQQKEWDLENGVVFELDLSLLFSQIKPFEPVRSIPRFPAASRDMAIVVAKETPAAAVKERIKALGGELLQSVEIFDVYTGKPVPEDRKSLAFTLRYQSFERTLTDEEINLLNSRILDGIQQEFSAEWRK